MRTLAIRVSLLALGIAASAGAQRDTAFSWSKKLPEGARFSIRNLNGLIDVRPGTTDRVEVRATIRVDSRAVSDVTFDVRERGADSVEICVKDRGTTLCDPGEFFGDNHPSVRFTVEVPRGLRLTMQTMSGDVIVMQPAAEVIVSTGSGDVVVRESASRVVANTGSGDVTVAAANGPVRATTGNGNVLVATYGGPVNASSGNGDVEVRMITVAPPPDQQVMSVSTGNGNVRLTLPPDFSGELDADTGNGKVTSDFSVNASRRESSRLRGSIGGGAGLRIRVHSGNGRVEIRKG